MEKQILCDIDKMRMDWQRPHFIIHTFSRYEYTFIHSNVPLSGNLMRLTGISISIDSMRSRNAFTKDWHNPNPFRTLLMTIQLVSTNHCDLTHTWKFQYDWMTNNPSLICICEHWALSWAPFLWWEKNNWFKYEKYSIGRMAVFFSPVYSIRKVIPP